MRRDPDCAPANGKMRRRGTDRFEDAAAWALMFLGLVLLMVAAMVGVGTRADTIERASAVRATHTEVVATVIDDVPVLAGADGGILRQLWARARWVGPDGVNREDNVLVWAGERAGSEVTVWVDRDGRIGTSPTSSESEALLAGVLAGFFTLLVGGILLGGVWVGVRWVTAVRNARRWEREWAQFGPEWTRHLR